MKKLRVLATGGCGFVGSNLIKDIIDSKVHAEIIVVDNLCQGTRPIRIRWEGNNSKQIEIFKNNIINFIKSNIYEQ
jgi:dTDP-D-glucose 4,6-dehydratase